MKTSEQLVPKLRFSEFQEGWKKNDIGNVSRIYGRIGYRGYTVQDIVEKGEGAITLSPSNFINNHIDISKSTYISWDKYEESPEIKIYNRDILFVKTGSTFGKTAFVQNLNEPATINPQIVVLKNITIHNEFLGYVITLPLIRKQVESIVVGGAIPTMSQKELSKMVFNLPPLPEQQKIAAFLTDVDAKITQLTKKKTLLEQYKKGVMQKIFNQELRFKPNVIARRHDEAISQNKTSFPDWEEKKLGEVCDVRDGTHDSPKYVKQGYPLITSKNLNSNGKLDFDDVSFINELDYININKRSKVNIGDIIFGMIGTIGNPVLLKEDGFAIKNVALIKEKETLLNVFLIHYLKSNHILKQFHIQNSGGTQKFVALGIIRNLKILTPSIKEQTKIANFLSDIDTKIEAVNTKIENSKTFKKGLLQQMFV